MKATWTQQNFNGGEWSPKMYGRFGLDKYKTSLAKCLNFIPELQGGLTRRPGTRFVVETKHSNKTARLVRFEFSTTQAYVLEFGDGYIRFCANSGQVLNAAGTGPLEVATTYTAAEVHELVFAQSADTLYIAHRNHPPAKLLRLGATNWSLQDIDFLDGPYLPLNATATTLTCSGVGPGHITVTASSTIGINDGQGFRTLDVGRHIRIKNGIAWGWGVITYVTSATSIGVAVNSAIGGRQAVATGSVSGGHIVGVTVTDPGGGYGSPPLVTFSGGGSGASAIGGVVLDTGKVSAIQLADQGNGYNSPVTVSISPPAGTTPASTVAWRLGVWGGVNGYPGTVTFFEDRLYWAGCTQFPQRVDGSAVSEYENFQPSAANNVITDADAVSFTLNANDVNEIRWMVSDERGLIIGTAGAEWLLRATSIGYPITPTNVQARPSSSYGSAKVQPVRAGRHTLFVQRDGRKLREMAYLFQIDGFQALDVSAAAEHLLAGGVKEMVVQKTPQQIVWMVRNDGALVGMTYEKEQEVLGLHEHRIGGWSDPGKTQPARVESVCCIPSTDGSRDEVWLLVKRVVDGAEVRYIEVMSKMWGQEDGLENMIYLDASATYTGSAATTISGLDWLEGETVQVLANGATHPECNVASGAIHLNFPATTVQVGLPYTSDAQTLRIEAGGADGAAQSKLKRIHRVGVRLLQTVGLKVGPAFDNLETIPFRSSADRMDQHVTPFSEDKAWISISDTYNRNGYLCLRQDQPLPCNVQLLVAQLETQDGG